MACPLAASSALTHFPPINQIYLERPYGFNCVVVLSRGVMKEGKMDAPFSHTSHLTGRISMGS